MSVEFTALKQSYPVEIGYQLNDGVRTVQRFDALSKENARQFEDKLIEFLQSMRNFGTLKDAK